MNAPSGWPAGVLHASGKGRPVVFVHGLGGTHAVWEPQVRRLEDRHRLIRYDLRGSGAFGHDGPVSLQLWCDDLAGLLHALGEPAVVVGHSLGTLIVQAVLEQHPERVRGAVLAGVNRSPPPARRDAILQRAAKVRETGMASIVDELLAGATSPATRQDKPEVLAAVRAMLVSQPSGGYAASCEAMASSTRPDISGFRGPLLLLAGEDDTISPPELARQMAQECGASLEILPRCGHWIPLEQAAATSAALEGFLAAG